VAAFQAVGCGFESRFPLHENNAGVAQLVEQLICNQQVTGSSPVASSKKSMYFNDKIICHFNFFPLSLTLKLKKEGVSCPRSSVGRALPW
jgi:hypothetical protein